MALRLSVIDAATVYMHGNASLWKVCAPSVRWLYLWGVESRG